MNGYTNSYNELLILIKQYNPKIISLQETHKPSQNIPIPVNFEIYFTLLIHKSLQHTQIPTGHIFDAIALKVHSAKKFILFAAYIPPK